MQFENLKMRAINMSIQPVDSYLSYIALLNSKTFKFNCHDKRSAISSNEIVRVVNDTVEQTDLQIGDNSIVRHTGTESKLECGNEKRAAIINVSAIGEMTITPAIKCYIKTTKSTKWEILEAGVTTAIKPGDICSLLPDKHWFKIISVPDDLQRNNLKRKMENNIVESPAKKFCPNLVWENQLNSGNLPNDFASGDTIANSPTIEVAEDTSSTLDASSNERVSNENEKGDSANDNVPENEIKKHNDTDGEDNDIKNQNDTNVQSSDINVQSNSTNVQSNDTNVQSSDTTVQSSNPNSPHQLPSAASNNQQTNSIRRDRCAYGSNCYRKNRTHKVKYSHPGDADHNLSDDRPQCKYGIKCYRKGSQHRANYKHTSRRIQRDSVVKNEPKYRDDVDDSTDEESVEESDYDPSNKDESSEEVDEWDEEENESNDSD